MVQNALHHLEYEGFSWASSSFHSQSAFNTYNTGLERASSLRKERNNVPQLLYRE